ncbi:MAG: mucoidy inhibitor MuiA family protein [Opitutaceae bacterium]|nr:mucoidy inhibitor MuiA family protein [Cephaloticoccus sp.]MCP5529400.1 mucoidy inhibitor MuiA family protein [Opitutaceae bacterium]
MKRFTLFLAACLALAAGLRANAIDSRITAVTVYSDRAVVTRTADTKLSAGINELTFNALPANLLDQSLQVSGSGSTAVTILDVTAKQTFLPETPDPRRKDLEDQIKALREKDRSLADRASVLRTQSDLIGRLQTSAVSLGTGEKSERPNLDEVRNVLEYGQQQLLELAVALQDLDTQRDALQAKITALQNQLNELRPANRRSVKTVVVRVQSESAGDFNLALNYTVGGASWSPGYDARVASNDNKLQLGYFGNVRQNTGEDWNNVALTLSTARPSLGGSAPELGAWNLDVYKQPMRPDPMVTLSNFEAPAVKDYGYLKSNAAERTRIGMEIQKATIAQASVDTAATSATFKIAVPATIASDNSVQKVPVTTVELNAALSYATTPKVHAAAFLNAKVFNNSDYPLLAGAMNVFLDGTFVATSHLTTTMPGEKFDLALGADEGIAIEHKRVKKFTEETGVFSKDHRITYEYLITVQNNKRSTARVIVTDQVPVSRNEKIVVKVQAPPEKEVKPDAEGLLKWTLDLKPGEKRELTVKFTVEHSSDVQVDGLE